MSYESFADADISQKIKDKKTKSYNVFLNKFNIDYSVADKYIDSRNIFLNYVAYVYDEYILEVPLKNGIELNKKEDYIMIQIIYIIINILNTKQNI